jgi:UDPglucose 6-dehydrogenase
LNYFGSDLSDKTIGIWGLSFKPNTDDIREAPARKIINDLLEHGATIKAFDPEAMENTKAILGDKIQFCNNEYEAAEGTDALGVVTEWSVFRRPSFIKLKRVMNEAVIFDGRNLYELDEMAEHGFYYESIGRKIVIGKE